MKSRGFHLTLVQLLAISTQPTAEMTWSPEVAVCEELGTLGIPARHARKKSVGQNFWIVYEVTGAGPAYSSACCGGGKSKILCSATTQRCSKCGIVIKARHTPSQEIWTVVLQLRESVSLALQVFRCPQHPHQPFAGPQALTADQSPTQPLWCVQRSRSQNHTAVYPSKHLSPSRSHLSPP